AGRALRVGSHPVAAVGKRRPRERGRAPPGDAVVERGPRGGLAGGVDRLGGGGGGFGVLVTGSATAKNMRSVPIPAANSMDAQAIVENSGLAFSGPSLGFPNRESAREITKASTTPARAT